MRSPKSEHPRTMLHQGSHWVSWGRVMLVVCAWIGVYAGSAFAVNPCHITYRTFSNNKSNPGPSSFTVWVDDSKGKDCISWCDMAKEGLRKFVTGDIIIVQGRCKLNDTELRYYQFPEDSTKGIPCSMTALYSLPPNYTSYTEMDGIRYSPPRKYDKQVSLDACLEWCKKTFLGTESVPTTWNVSGLILKRVMCTKGARPDDLIYDAKKG